MNPVRMESLSNRRGLDDVSPSSAGAMALHKSRFCDVFNLRSLVGLSDKPLLTVNIRCENLCRSAVIVGRCGADNGADRIAVCYCLVQGLDIDSIYSFSARITVCVSVKCLAQPIRRENHVLRHCHAHGRGEKHVGSGNNGG